MEQPLSILSWNILHGGGARRTPGIVLTLLDQAADVIVLSEFRARMGGQIAGVLADHGWRFQVRTDPEPGVNGMFVAAREPMTVLDWACPEPRRGVSVRLEKSGVVVTAVHIPDARASDAHALVRKSAFWHALLEHASRLRDGAHAVIGDFNTGRHRQDERGSSFTSVALLGRFSAMGFVDAYRLLHPDGREFSWESGVGGRFRLDHAFVSDALRPCIEAVQYGHEERALGLSDHAFLRLNLGTSGKKRGEMTKTTEKQGDSTCPADNVVVQETPCSVGQLHTHRRMNHG